MTNPIAARIAALAAKQKEQGVDLTVAKSGGGDFPVAASGVCRVRLVGYQEWGIHTSEWKGVKKHKPRCTLTFELSGPLHPPIELEDGRKIPHVIRVDEVIGFNEKNGYMKIFAQLKVDYPNATNFFELIGCAWRATVVHPKPKKEGGRIWPKLRDANGYTFKSKTYQNEETGEPAEVKVAEALTTPFVFPWDFAELADWDALYIEGAYDDGSTKNKLQEKIKRAQNFDGSPIFLALMEAGREAELALDPTYKEFGAGATKAEGDDEDSEEDGPAKAKTPEPAKSELAKAAEDADPLAGV